MIADTSKHVQTKFSVTEAGNFTRAAAPILPRHSSRLRLRAGRCPLHPVERQLQLLRARFVVFRVYRLYDAFRYPLVRRLIAQATRGEGVGRCRNFLFMTV
jgi:hypothetical protein